MHTERVEATPINLGRSGDDLDQRVGQCRRANWRREAEAQPLPHRPERRGYRNSDNTFIKQVLGWGAQSISIRKGLKPTYEWIEQQILPCDRKAG